MRTGVKAVLVSVAIHGALGAAIALYLAAVPCPVTTVELDLSSVELSLAEREDSTKVAVAECAASAPSEPAPRPPIERECPIEPPREELFEAMAMVERPELVDALPQEEEKVVTPSAKAEPAHTDQVQGDTVKAVQQARVEAPPRPRQTIKPIYPKGSRRRREEGKVLLEIAVSAAGEVERATVVESSGFNELDDAAVRAALSARFEPAKSGNGAVASVARLTLAFKLK